MKKLLLILAILFASQGAVKASHVLGGEIRWDCLSNGRFVFYAKVFRDCTGIDYPFNTKTLDIVGSPLPRNASNGFISSIVLQPDSGKWIQNRYGDTSPTCKPGGETITCGDGDEGAVQQFFFKSSPIQLRGTPPSNGWKFYLQQPCCRPNVTNLAGSGTMMLRAVMYPDANNTPVDQCHDSSPEFLALPTNMLCRGYEFTYNHTAIDRDLDSLVYAWDRTYNTPPAAPQPVPYANGFSPTSPTPSTNQDIAATLDPLTGQIKMGVWSGSPLTLDYLTVVRVDAWRGGTVIASVFREIPFVFFDCPRLPSGQINRPPSIYIDGDSADGVIVDIVAGQTVSIPFQARDLDFSGGVPGLQKITVEPAGFMFSRDLQDNEYCYYPDPSPTEKASCATLRDQDPIYNGIAEPPRFEISGYAGIATEFVWETRCHHIATQNTGVVGQNQGIYNFVMRTYDDHCPIPGINYPTITVRVRDPLPLLQPIMKGLSVNLDGSVTYQWAPPLDTAYTFARYHVEFSQPNNNFPATAYISLDTNERRYRSERRSNGIRVYQPQLSDPTKADLLKRVNRDFYLRMRSVSGCKQNIRSEWSQPARVIEPTVAPSGNFPSEPRRSKATINWNRAKANNAPTHPYYLYESPTKYYIWTNDQYQATAPDYPGLAVNGNWVLRGSTFNTSFQVASTTCSGDVAFRVEARDTIISYLQGHGPPSDSLDTMVFSTWSVIDTMFMKNPGAIPNPKYDTLEVRENGDIWMKVDAGNAGTTGEYRIYRNSVNKTNLLGTIVKPEDTLLVTTLDGQLNAYDIIIEGVDECDTTIKELSNTYQTWIPTGNFPNDPCDPSYNLNWINPTGFPTGVRGYRVYRRVKETGATNFTAWELVKTVTGANNTTTTVTARANTEYRFKIVAYDDEDAVIISAEHYLAVGNKRTYEVVQAPEMRCSYVNDDGTVSLYFIPADPSVDPAIDTTGNWVSYQFQYRIKGASNWTTFPGGASLAQDDDTIRITGIDARVNSYEFRATSLSGCSGTEPAPYNEINLIEPTATAIVGDSSKKVSVSWTGTGVFSNTPELLYKGIIDDTPPLNYFNGGAVLQIEPSQPKSFTDGNNSQWCDTIATYFLTKMDQLSGCMNRSRPDTARIIDQIPPPPQQLDFLTYEPNPTGQNLIFDRGGVPTLLPAAEYKGDLVMHWSVQPVDDIDSLMIFAPNNSTGQNQSFQTVKWKSNFTNGTYKDTIYNAQFDASDTAQYFSAQSIDACERRAVNFDEFDYHKNIDVDVEFSQCDSSMIIRWNGYYYFNVSEEVEYEVQQMYTTIDNGVKYVTYGYDPIGTTVDSVFVHKVDRDSVEYTYRVVASPKGRNIAAASNWATEMAVFDPVPKFNYFTYATVKPSKEVELQFYKDTSIAVGGYTVMRGEDKVSLYPSDRLGANNSTELVTFEDLNADTDGRSYFYQIIVENQCGNAIDTTNFATTVHLTVVPKNEALANHLEWNEYQDWDSTVSFYNIYRGVNGNSAQTLYATVPAGENTFNRFVDDVTDNSYAIGDYCYKVEAVQGNVNPEYAGAIEPATSMSNEVCVIQKPLFYVPNAFAPDGMNKMFGPEGQFFDFTKYEMIIYNRWGEAIFETRDITKGWDGTVDGELAPLGSYVYTIRFEDAEGEEHRRKGTVTLIR